MNDDTISRKAAIDAVRTYYADEYFIIDSIEELIEKLPSVQPEHLVKESGNLVKGLVNDCISRKAAIEICNDAVDFWDGTSGVTGIWSVRNEIGYFIAALMFMAGDDDD